MWWKRICLLEAYLFAKRPQNGDCGRATKAVHFAYLLANVPSSFAHILYMSCIWPLVAARSVVKGWRRPTVCWLTPPLLVWSGGLLAEVYRVRTESASSAALRADHETAVAHLAAGDVTRLWVLSLHPHHHQHRRTRHEGCWLCCWHKKRTAIIWTTMIMIIITSGQRMSTKGRTASPDVIEDWMNEWSVFATGRYCDCGTTGKRRPMLLNGPDKPQNYPFPLVQSKYEWKPFTLNKFQESVLLLFLVVLHVWKNILKVYQTRVTTSPRT